MSYDYLLTPSKHSIIIYNSKNYDNNINDNNTKTSNNNTKNINVISLVSLIVYLNPNQEGGGTH